MRLGLVYVNICLELVLEITRNAFYEGIKFAKVGYRIGDISHAIESYVQKNGFDVILEYQGHGIRKKYA